MSRVVLRLVEQLARGFMALSEIALVLMMLAITADVAMRALFNSPIRGTYDAVGILLCISALFAIAHVIFTRHEVVIDLIDTVLPPKATGFLKRFWASISVVVLSYIVWAMVQPMAEARAYGDRSLELGLPLWYVWVAALVGVGGALLGALGAVVAPTTRLETDRKSLEESGE
ncbi:TRAP transporter small permease [Thioclava sp. BHET1]|uniref:TRAP transporter small permease protein n=1 Tax=Thioclava dalianensis TaxID=1185766 RepID=A0A074U0H6_9RHOB|nr:TRAP transporter small permease [Thioclava dalianensis]KEP68182.1 hypothetical protein DL1_14600 [Thioclava dalianensis]TMV91818.1 TRAP transporter small permease [Thioclava sp. BHET1]SFN86196.1 TRAP-type C4-dicarboxylate transport system, small permease component [Thioclava dalianensis]